MKDEHRWEEDIINYVQNNSNMNCVYCFIITLEYGQKWNNIFNATNKSKYYVKKKTQYTKAYTKKITTKGINQSIRLQTSHFPNAEVLKSSRHIKIFNIETIEKMQIKSMLRFHWSLWQW